MKVYIHHYHLLSERLEYLVPELNKNGIKDIEVVYGISRNDINESHFSKFSNDKSLVQDRLNYTNCPIDYDIFNQYERTVLANFLTHIEIWEKIANGEENYALILENDAVLLNDFQQKWEKLISTIPNDLDIAYLHNGCGFTVENKQGLKIENGKIWYYCPIKESRTCCSYLVSKSFCKLLLKDLYPIALGVDHELNYLQKKLNASVYWSYPELFNEGSASIYGSSYR
jgi:glycosyl transferase family 25